jgi:hypothetical protein
MCCTDTVCVLLKMVLEYFYSFLTARAKRVGPGILSMPIVKKRRLVDSILYLSLANAALSVRGFFPDFDFLRIFSIYQ